MEEISRSEVGIFHESTNERRPPPSISSALYVFKTTFLRGISKKRIDLDEQERVKKTRINETSEKRRRSPQDDIDIDILLGVKPEDQDKERRRVSSFS